jgi:hypothetical protein
MLEFRDRDYEEWQANQLFTRPATNQTTSWLVHSWNTFGAQMNHEQTQTHKTHHSSDLGETTTFPLIVFSVLGHRASTQMSFCPEMDLGVTKFLKLGLPQLWRPITLCVDLRLRWGLKKICIPRWNPSNNMSHMERKLGKFLTFNGWKSNWQLDSWPFFWP